MYGLARVRTYYEGIMCTVSRILFRRRYYGFDWFKLFVCGKHCSEISSTRKVKVYMNQIL